MPQSLSQVVIHLVFSTKNREPTLSPSLEASLHAYLSTITRDELGCECYRVGGMSDHVHLAVGLSRTQTIAHIVEKVKTSSSQWMKNTHSITQFSWQRGYGAFSVSPRDLPKLISYIDDQKTHHEAISFQDEYRSFLKKYGVSFDEKYVWD